MMEVILTRPYSGALCWPILDAQSRLCAALGSGVRGIGLQCRSRVAPERGLSVRGTSDDKLF